MHEYSLELYDLRFHGQEGQSTSCFSVSFLSRFMRVHVLYTVCTYIHLIRIHLYIRYTYIIYNTKCIKWYMYTYTIKGLPLYVHGCVPYIHLICTHVGTHIIIRYTVQYILNSVCVCVYAKSLPISKHVYIVHTS